MRLTDDEREAILDAAFDWSIANGSKTGEVFCFFRWLPDGFNLRVESMAKVHAPILLDRAFRSAGEALAFFQPQPVQLSLFEMEV